MRKYLHKIRPYSKKVINGHKTQGKWKIQFTISINFISFEDSKETRAMYTKSNNIEILIGNETDEMIEPLLQKNQ